jgi:hypothetical protein
VLTEDSVRSENTGVPAIREINGATTMSSLFVALFALVAQFRTGAALQAEILALRHQLVVTPSSVGTAELSPGIGPGNPAAFPEGQKLRPTFVI